MWMKHCTVADDECTELLEKMGKGGTLSPQQLEEAFTEMDADCENHPLFPWCSSCCPCPCTSPTTFDDLIPAYILPERSIATIVQCLEQCS